MELSLNSSFILLQDVTDLKSPVLHVLSVKDYKYKSVLRVSVASFGKRDPEIIAVILKQTPQSELLCLCTAQNPTKMLDRYNKLS
jgi:hypothetical protein